MRKAYWGTLLRLTPLEETEEGKGSAGKDAKRRQGEEGRRGQGRRLGHEAVSRALAGHGAGSRAGRVLHGSWLFLGLYMADHYSPLLISAGVLAAPGRRAVRR